MSPPRRPSLDRERVLREALAIADEEGLERLTLRALAKRLGVSPMATYWHFEDKAALLAQLVDFAVAQYEVAPSASGSLVERLRPAFTEMYRGLDEHPGLLPLIGEPSYRGEVALRAMEAILTAMRDAGMSPSRAQRAYHLVMSFTIGALTMSHAAGDPDWGRASFQANLPRVLAAALSDPNDPGPAPDR